jgi:hypothetical protein
MKPAAPETVAVDAEKITRCSHSCAIRDPRALLDWQCSREGYGAIPDAIGKRR